MSDICELNHLCIQIYKGLFKNTKGQKQTTSPQNVYNGSKALNRCVMSLLSKHQSESQSLATVVTMTVTNVGRNRSRSSLEVSLIYTMKPCLGNTTQLMYEP